ncbi:hypothetical protein PHLGIDRAFT_121570, partial [Phlebiopsis gigantea 11061_1 CR5-6]
MHPRTRDPSRASLDRRGVAYPHASSPHHAISYTATPPRTIWYTDRYSSSLSASTPLSSPTTASSSPPPSTSPLAHGSHRTRAAAIDIKGRDSSPWPYARELPWPAGRYAYVKTQEQLYESDGDDMASSSQPPSPTFPTHRRYAQPQPLYSRPVQQRSTHHRTFSSSSSSYSSATSPALDHPVPRPQPHPHAHHVPHQPRQQPPRAPAKPRPSPAPAAFAPRYDALPYYYRPRRADEQLPLSLHDLTDDDASPRKPPAAAVEDAEDALPKLVSPRRRVSFST